MECLNKYRWSDDDDDGPEIEVEIFQFLDSPSPFVENQ